MATRLEQDRIERDARRHSDDGHARKRAGGAARQKGQRCKAALAKGLGYGRLCGARLAARLLGDDEIKIGSGESFTQLSSPSQ
jgi:hypothetical protein